MKENEAIDRMLIPFNCWRKLGVGCCKCVKLGIKQGQCGGEANIVRALYKDVLHQFNSGFVLEEPRLTRSVLFFSLVLATLPVLGQGLDDFLDTETLKLSEGYDKRLRYTPGTVIVFDQGMIERSGALNVAELLERVVGVHMTRKSFGSSADQFVRGIDGNLLILHNGVEITKLIPELLTMPVADLERIEVLKGSHYPLYGASAVLGTVNLVTRRVARDETMAGIRAGTLDTSQVWLRRSDRRGQLGYSGFLSLTGTSTTDGEIEADRQTLLDQAFGTVASFAPGDGYFGADAIDGRLSLEFGDHWTLHQYVNHRELGTGVGLAQALDPQGEEQVSRYSADLRYEQPVARGVFEGRFTYNWTQAEYNDTLLLPPGTLGGAFPDGVLQSYGQTGQEFFVEGLYRLTQGRNTLDLGLGGSRGEVVNDFDRRNYTFDPGASVPIPLGMLVDFGDTAPLFADDYSVHSVYAMLRNEIQLSDDWSLNAGVRVDRSSDYGSFVNPRLGLDWTAGQLTNVSLLYGESAKAPSEIQLTSNGLFSPLGSPDLKPAKIRLVELAVDHRWENGVSLVSNLYWYRQSDVIGVVTDDQAPIGTRFENLSAREEGSGIELLVGWNLGKGIRARLGASVKTNTSDNIENAGAPRYQPFAEIDAVGINGWDANLAVIGVVDRERADDDARPDIDDYTIVNATAIRRDFLMSDLDLSLSVQNLFDADAREDISEAIPEDLPVFPRRILLGLTLDF